MQAITYRTFGGTSLATANELNIFIDLYSVMHRMFSRALRCNIENSTLITSGIINMCIHYRSFFRPMGVKTRFFLVYSHNTCDINEKFIYGYNKEFKEKTSIKMYQDITNINFELLKVMCPYLPDIHFVKSNRNYESSVIMAYIIEHYGQNKPNLILTSDLYPLQLTYMYPNTTLLIPRKKFDSDKNYVGDESIMVPLMEKEYEYRNIFWNIVAERRKIKVDSLLNINPVNFTLYSAMTRFPERNVLPITRTQAEAVKFILKLGGDRLPVLPSQLDYDQEISMAIPTSIVQARYKALDVQYILQFYREDVECRDIKIQNLDDNGTIANINAKYFGNNPIDINRL
jgi:hypothetical protein